MGIEKREALMYTRLMTSLKKLFNSTYNLGRASQPEPLPEMEVRLDYIKEVIHQKQGSSSKISSEELRKAFLAHKKSEDNAKTAKLNATPKWLTDEQLTQIRDLYIMAKEMTKATGIEYVVDHIMPLQGETLSGLHVPWNLQIITDHQNTQKHNKVWL